MSDHIDVSDLLVRTIIGVNEDERNNRQDVVINLRLYTSTRDAAASDDLEQAVNYRTVTKRVIEFAEQSRFHLVETLAEEIARLCLSDPRIERVRVQVEKPGALRFARSVGVTIERSRSDV